MLVLDVDYWLAIGGLAAQAGWLGPEVSGCFSLAVFFCDNRVNRVKSHNVSVMMTVL